MSARFVCPVILGVGVAMLIGAAPASAQDPKDFDAIQQVIEKYVATVNGAEFEKANRQQRLEMLRPFYRPDSSFSKEDLPLFFGPVSEPVARGANAHLDNTNLNFEWLFNQGLTYALRIDEFQIELGGNLAVVSAVTTSGFASADRKTNYSTRGRATIVLNKMDSGEWLISHEHDELFNANNPAIMTKARLEKEVTKLKRPPVR